MFLKIKYTTNEPLCFLENEVQSVDNLSRRTYFWDIAVQYG